MDLRKELIYGFLSGKTRLYSETITRMFGSAIVSYLPLGESVGTVAVDAGARKLNGAYSATGITYGETGIGDDKTSPLFDGTNGIINWYSAAFAAAFNPAAGTLFGWIKMSAAGIWTDGAGHYQLTLAADGNNFIVIYKPTNNNRFIFAYKAGGTSSVVTDNTLMGGRTGFVPVAITWDKAADQVIAYVDGVQIGTTVTGLGTWAGALASNQAVIGAWDTAKATPHSGNMAHALLLNRAATPVEIQSISNPYLPYMSNAFLGGSITLGMAATNYTLSTVANVSYFGILRYWLYNNYQKKWTHNNAGIGSTGSWYGLTRLTTDVLDKGASLVIIEYAVNDGATDFNKATEEALIRRVRTSLPNAKIIMPMFLMVTNSAVNDATNVREETKQNLIALADHYGITYVDYAAAVQALVTAETNVTQDFFPVGDSVHPNDFGHALAATMIEAELASLSNNATSPLPDRLHAASADYENTPILRNGIDNDGETGTGWSTSGTIRQSTTANDTISFTGTFQSFGLNQGDGVGTWQYSIDGGGYSGSIAGSGLNGYEVGARESHTITIKVISGTVKISKFMAI